MMTFSSFAEREQWRRACLYLRWSAWDVLEEEVTPWAWCVCQWLALHLRDQRDGAAGGHLDGSGLDGRVEKDGCYYSLVWSCLEKTA